MLDYRSWNPSNWDSKTAKLSCAYAQWCAFKYGWSFHILSLNLGFCVWAIVGVVLSNKIMIMSHHRYEHTWYLDIFGLTSFHQPNTEVWQDTRVVYLSTLIARTGYFIYKIRTIVSLQLSIVSLPFIMTRPRWHHC